jgi:Ca2+/Na+ antiporter
MLFYIMGAIAALFCLGLGILMIVKARGLGQQAYRFSDDALNLRFWVWSYRAGGIFAFGVTIYLLYVMLFS